MIILIIYILVSCDQNILLIFYVKDRSHFMAMTSILYKHYRTETVRSTKDVYNSEILSLLTLTHTEYKKQNGTVPNESDPSREIK